MNSIITTSNSKMFLLLILILITGIVTCTKDSQGPGMAKYYMKSNNDKCSGIHVHGSYYRGEILNDSNSIDVEAYVTHKGSYDITTNSANGMHFNASGVLSDTGDYIFHLVSHGAPKTKENTRLSLLSTDQSSCSFEIPVLDYTDTINNSEYAWEFYDNGIYHHGHVDSSAVSTNFLISSFAFKGNESTNSNAAFRLSLWSFGQIQGTFTDSLNQSFEYDVDQNAIFRTYRKSSTVTIDSYDGATNIIKGGFSWKGSNDEGILHEVKKGKFYVKLQPAPN